MRERDNGPSLSRVREACKETVRQAKHVIDDEINQAGFSHRVDHLWVRIECTVDGVLGTNTLRFTYPIIPISTYLTPLVALEYAAELARANLFVANLLSETERWRWGFAADALGKELGT